uniref:G-protein coupled receptors family 1 profile domain-containing protein n=1 Tax=Cavia porcellus TaxID=10141 RepID=A0A286Y032_CAVPO
MASRNHSTVHMFVLVGLNQQPERQLPLFLFFLWIYGVTVMGNLGMILLIAVCPLLHTPIYYFLVHGPALFLCSIAVAEGYLLTAMAYDHYIAIMLVSFNLGILPAVAHTSATMKLNFCQSYIISHYFCDVLPLLNFSCSSTHLNELLLFFIAGFNTLVPTLAVAVSYIFIFCSVLHIQSSERHCPLMTVGIFFGSITYMYFKPPSSNSLEQEKVSSMFCITVIPILWNQDVKKALRMVWMGR